LAGLWLVFIWAKKCLADSRRFVDSSWQLCFPHKAATGFKIEVKYSGTIFELRKVVILYTGYLSVAKTLNTNCFILALSLISHNNAFKINKQRIRND
jgi:nucleoside-specific outer membrane channel protein Tsx